METLKIGQLAREAGLGVETVRFYERRGLIADPPRRASGYRQYPQETVARLRFIRRAKELGFSLNEIKELLDLRVSPEIPKVEVKRTALVKIADLEERIAMLERMKRALEEITAACSGEVPAGSCLILDALESGPSEEEGVCLTFK